MPVIGWALGSQFMGIIGPIDHWIAFILLAFIGGKMLWEAFTEDEDEDESDGKDAEKIDLGEYLILAIATSIDALAVGISFAALSVDIVPAVSLIGSHNVYLLRRRRSDRPHLWRALRKTRHHRGRRRAHPHRPQDFAGAPGDFGAVKHPSKLNVRMRPHAEFCMRPFHADFCMSY